jgi:hypothetical protein
MLGTYAVTGTLEAQTCNMDAQNPWAFNVRLSRSGDILFWLQDSSPALAGNIDLQGNAHVKTVENIDLQGADGGVTCAVVRTDVFEAALGTTMPPPSFAGTLTYHYDVDPSAACPSVPLPCDVAYTVAAKLSQPGH